MSDFTTEQLEALVAELQYVYPPTHDKLAPVLAAGVAAPKEKD